jgi:hypothetical protein
MRNITCFSLLIIFCGSLSAQSGNDRLGKPARIVFEGQPATLSLAPHLTTTIRLPEPVNSVIVGDSNLFQVEYSPEEPLLVFAKPATATSVASNLVISTAGGRQFVLTLKNLGNVITESGVDLLVYCRPAGILFIEDTFPTALISETLRIESSAVDDLGSRSTEFDLGDTEQLDDLVNRQSRWPLGNLQGDRIRVGIGQVLEQGSRLIVSFSVVNSSAETIEIVPPQVQLANQTTSGVFRRTRWNTVQQLPVDVYRITDRRLGPRQRVDGVVTFERPAIKQSTEHLFLQIADSAAVDQPVLAPVSFRATNEMGERQ